MITPDQITNGAVFKLDNGAFVVIGLSSPDSDDCGYLDMQPTVDYFDVDYGASKDNLIDYLNTFNATLCPNLKLAVVEKNQQ